MNVSRVVLTKGSPPWRMYPSASFAQRVGFGYFFGTRFVQQRSRDIDMHTTTEILVFLGRKEKRHVLVVQKSEHVAPPSSNSSTGILNFNQL